MSAFLFCKIARFDTSSMMRLLHPTIFIGSSYPRNNIATKEAACFVKNKQKAIHLYKAMKLSVWLPFLISAQSLLSVASSFQPSTPSHLKRMTTSNRTTKTKTGRNFLDSKNNFEPMRLRGGGETKMSSTGQAASAPKKRVRIPSFDSMRFLFITCIVCGHFIRFASPSDFVFKFFSQHNVIVGAFFALSGYVTAYTSTEVGEAKASPKLTETPSQQWVLSRVFGYFPLHLVTLLLFSPLFVYVDMYYSGLTVTLRNAFLSVTMLQSWFPNLAEIWNAPTCK